MSRGFGATFGAGSTDRITSALTTNPAIRSWAMWVYRNGDGGGSVGRLFHAEPGLLIRNSGTTIQLFRSWATDAEWSCPRPSAGAWHHYGITYNGSLTTNDPLMYVDGVSQTVTQVGGNPTGSILTSAVATHIGNYSVSTAVWDGMIAELGIWNAILTAGNMASLAGNGVPVIRPDAIPTSLVEYIPMLKANDGLAGTPTLVGTVVRPHPPLLSRFPPGHSSRYTHMLVR